MSELLYNRVKRALYHQAAPLDVAECHGVLSGMFCAHGSVPLQAWLEECVDPEEGEPLAGEDASALRDLYESTLRAINSEDLAFEPCLPRDEAPLLERTQALAGWCQGYLYGLGSGGIGKRATPQARELIEDFARLAQAEMGAGGVDELEASYTELVEFVKVGVLLINEELQPLRAGRGIH